MVPLVGLEPTLSCLKWILNPSRLPIPPQWPITNKYINNLLIKKFQFNYHFHNVSLKLAHVSFANFVEDKNSGTPNSKTSAGLSPFFTASLAI